VLFIHVQVIIFYNVEINVCMVEFVSGVGKYIYTTVATLVLGSQSRQKGYKVVSQEEARESRQRGHKGAGQEEAQKSHHIILGV